MFEDAELQDLDDFRDPLSNFDPVIYSTELKRALAEDSISSIQCSPYVTTEANTKVRDAMQILFDLNVSSLLIVQNKKLIGIFTERDILEKVAERLAYVGNIPVRDVMTVNPCVVYECDPAGTALAAIGMAGYRHVPVLNMSEELVGIVSPRRVFEFMEAHFDGPPEYISDSPI
jgi:CBS-domain-containing membrane protein